METDGTGTAQPPNLDGIRTKLLVYRFLNTVDVLDRNVWRYLERHGVDLEAMEPAGPIGRFRVAFDDYSSFERNDFGEDALVHIIHDVHTETAVDLVAWSMIQPHHFATYLGIGALLGADEIAKPRCQLWQTPVAWLRSGCRGACIVEVGLAAEVLRAAPGPFIAQDVAHAHELIRILPDAFGDRGRLLVERRSAT